jgi:hypothetical protein
VRNWAAKGLDEISRMPEWFFQAEEWAALQAAKLVKLVDGEWWCVA